MKHIARFNMIANQMSTCAVCMEDCNKSTRASTKCPYCITEFCRTCLQTYMLDNTADVPTCINTDCAMPWDREFLDSQFTRTFRLVTYKTHREKVLLDKERARLPSTQDDAAAITDCP